MIDKIDSNETLLMRAIAAGDVSESRKQLMSGANVNLCTGINYWESSPLALAIKHQHLDIVKLLVEFKVDFKYRYRDKFTALMLALKEINLKLDVNMMSVIIQLLKKNGADINAIGSGKSALTLAVKNNNIKLAIILIDQGANVNLNLWNDSALMIAAKNNSQELFDLLISKGADVDLVLGQTVGLDYMVSNNNLIGAKMFIDAGAAMVFKETINGAIHTNPYELAKFHNKIEMIAMMEDRMLLDVANESIGCIKNDMNASARITNRTRL